MSVQTCLYIIFEIWLSAFYMTWQSKSSLDIAFCSLIFKSVRSSVICPCARLFGWLKSSARTDILSVRHRTHLNLSVQYPTRCKQFIYYLERLLLADDNVRYCDVRLGLHPYRRVEKATPVLGHFEAGLKIAFPNYLQSWEGK